VVAPDGTSTTTVYTANFDGKDYPLTGSPIADMVSLKRIDARPPNALTRRAVRWLKPSGESSRLTGRR